MAKLPLLVVKEWVPSRALEVGFMEYCREMQRPWYVSRYTLHIHRHVDSDLQPGQKVHKTVMVRRTNA